jgi:glycosyltransferase involved in cell wall biosynthesis
MDYQTFNTQSNSKQKTEGNSNSDSDNNSKSPPFPQILLSKRIVLASESLGPINGVSRTTTQLILYLQRHGVDIQLYAPHYPGEELRPLPVGQVRRLNGAPLPFCPELSIAYPFRVDKLWGDNMPDLIYLASPASVGFQIFLQMQCYENPAPVMANFQTDLSAYGRILLPALLDGYSTWLLQLVQGYLFGHESVKSIFYPSKPVFDYLVEAGVPGDKCIHLGRGVDTETFNPAMRDEGYRQQIAPNGEIILVCVGRLSREKGFDFLAQVAERLAEMGLAFKLVIVGGNRNPAVEDRMRALFTPLGGKVTFTGFLEGKSLARAYAFADIFLHCSVTETFGLVVLEAMACGLPVVARDAGGPSEIVRDGETGFLVNPDSLDQFVARVVQLSKDRELRLGMAKVARDIAENTTWEVINNTVAWQIAKTIEQKEAADENFEGPSTWLRGFGKKVLVQTKLLGAMALISFIWGVAVIPLIMAGKLAHSRKGKAGQASPASTPAPKASSKSPSNAHHVEYEEDVWLGMPH